LGRKGIRMPCTLYENATQRQQAVARHIEVANTGFLAEFRGFGRDVGCHKYWIGIGKRLARAQEGVGGLASLPRLTAGLEF